MAKNNRWANASTGRTNNRDAQAHLLLGGKTLAQVGADNDLADSDLAWLLNKEQDVVGIIVSIKGKEYEVPFSKAIIAEGKFTPDTLLDCQFRVTNVTLKDENGDAIEVDGKIQYDETSAYMSLGKPGGSFFSKGEGVFSEESKLATA